MGPAYQKGFSMSLGGRKSHWTTRVKVTTTTSTWPRRYGLAMEGSNACPSVKGVKAVPLERCQEAALEAILPRGELEPAGEPGGVGHKYRFKEGN